MPTEFLGGGYGMWEGGYGSSGPAYRPRRRDPSFDTPRLGRDWRSSGADGGHSVGVVETKPKARAAVPSEQFGQVAEIVSWDQVAEIGEVVISGDTTNTPTDGRVFFGRKMVGEIIAHRIQPGAYNPSTGVRTLDELILTVRSKFCPSVGARIRHYVEPRPTVTRPGSVW